MIESYLRISPLRRSWCISACLLLLFFYCLPAKSISQTETDDQVTVTGIVRDRAGTFLSNISVFVNGTSRGTVTDAKGEFTLRAYRTDSIAVSSVGYESQLLPVGNDRVFYITLDANEGSLNDVVVVGFGRQRKISVVGAQSTLNPEELKLPVANINTMLAGRIAGVVGVQRSGQPGHGTGSAVRDSRGRGIRGASPAYGPL